LFFFSFFLLFFFFAADDDDDEDEDDVEGNEKKKRKRSRTESDWNVDEENGLSNRFSSSHSFFSPFHLHLSPSLNHSFSFFFSSSSSSFPSLSPSPNLDDYPPRLTSHLPNLILPYARRPAPVQHVRLPSFLRHRHRRRPKFDVVRYVVLPLFHSPSPPPSNIFPSIPILHNPLKSYIDCFDDEIIIIPDDVKIVYDVDENVNIIVDDETPSPVQTPVFGME
jgi:hypothetical protein